MIREKRRKEQISRIFSKSDGKFTSLNKRRKICTNFVQQSSIIDVLPVEIIALISTYCNIKTIIQFICSSKFLYKELLQTNPTELMKGIVGQKYPAINWSLTFQTAKAFQSYYNSKCCHQCLCPRLRYFPVCLLCQFEPDTLVPYVVANEFFCIPKDELKQLHHTPNFNFKLSDITAHLWKEEHSYSKWLHNKIVSHKSVPRNLTIKGKRVKQLARLFRSHNVPLGCLFQYQSHKWIHGKSFRDSAELAEYFSRRTTMKRYLQSIGQDLQLMQEPCVADYCDGYLSLVAAQQQLRILYDL